MYKRGSNDDGMFFFTFGVILQPSNMKSNDGGGDYDHSDLEVSVVKEADSNRVVELEKRPLASVYQGGGGRSWHCKMAVVRQRREFEFEVLDDMKAVPPTVMIELIRKNKVCLIKLSTRSFSESQNGDGPVFAVERGRR